MWCNVYINCSSISLNPTISTGDKVAPGKIKKHIWLCRAQINSAKYKTLHTVDGPWGEMMSLEYKQDGSQSRLVGMVVSFKLFHSAHVSL